SVPRRMGMSGLPVPPCPAPQECARMSTPVAEIIQRIRERQDQAQYHDLHWEGSYTDYLQLVQERPGVARNAFQRLYDMIVSFGAHKYTEYKKEITHYHFFDDPVGGGRDAIFGLDLP